MKALRNYIEILRKSDVSRVPLIVLYYFSDGLEGLGVSVKYEKTDDLVKIVLLSKIADTFTHLGKRVILYVELPPLMRYVKDYERYAEAYAKVLKAGFVWVRGYTVLDLNRCEVRYVDPNGKLRSKRNLSDYDVQAESICKLLDLNNRVVKNYTASVFRNLIRDMNDLMV